MCKTVDSIWWIDLSVWDAAGRVKRKKSLPLLLMFKMIIYGFLLFLLYKLVFEIVLPVSKATSQVKDKLREMQEQQRAQQANQHPAPPPQAQATRPKPDDYIEFEEVK